MPFRYLKLLKITEFIFQNRALFGLTSVSCRHFSHFLASIRKLFVISFFALVFAKWFVIVGVRSEKKKKRKLFYLVVDEKMSIRDIVDRQLLNCSC